MLSLQARELLDASHSGMEDVKKRVLEFLAVRKLSDSVTGPILCFAGPPGIGKTRSHSVESGTKVIFVVIAGLTWQPCVDELFKLLKHAGSNNPLILLDEVDKLFSGLHGSPSAALLEVLDPEQNNSFTDHYLESPVRSVQSAVYRHRQRPVENRGSTCGSSYCRATPDPSSITSTWNLPGSFTDTKRCSPIEDYTRESGVRQLERMIAATCRFVALRVADSVKDQNDFDSMMSSELPLVVTAENCRKILGKERFAAVDLVEQMGKFRLGTCFGLAWTPFGGEIECGKGKIVMTGKPGMSSKIDVARTCHSSNATMKKLLQVYPTSLLFRLHADSLDGADLHVHLPSGAVGKDGPSAGCALVSALFSLASNRLVRADTAVTGEISLTGHILPVGGIKEKVLGAHRAGIRRVILPLANRNDAEYIDKSIKDEMDIQFSSDIDDLLQKIMEKDSVSNVLSKL
ncbi:Lon protease proteolytic domain protein [Ostertagia ostertagi]